MKKMKKHEFEPVSLLTVENGVLELAIIPTKNQPYWLVPKSLILAIEPYDERIGTYLWKKPNGDSQDVAVYHLIDKQTTPDKLVVLEGNMDVYRLALQTAGEIDYIQVRISDVKDVELPSKVQEQIKSSTPNLFEDESRQLDFMYQAVAIGDTTYIIPDIDLIISHLVDLDD